MKKIIAITLAVLVLAALALPAFATPTVDLENGLEALQQGVDDIPELLLLDLALRLLDDLLQLAVIRSREGDVVCQLIDGKRISVFVDVAIDFGAIVFEIIPRLHRVALFLIYNRVR